MKAGKTFTLELDILKRKPTSSLVNRLLREFYGNNGSACTHDWSNWFATSEGLGRECKICHKIENKAVKDIKSPKKVA